MQVILLEMIKRLGDFGSTVTVKPGFARNFLLPKRKALRATEKNIAYFKEQKAALEKIDKQKRDDAQEIAGDLAGKIIVILRSASSGGQLYGSVTTRDIATSLSKLEGAPISHTSVVLKSPIKSLGIHSCAIRLHPDVTAIVKINVAQSTEGAQKQQEAELRESQKSQKKVKVDKNLLHMKDSLSTDEASVIADSAIENEQALNRQFVKEEKETDQEEGRPLAKKDKGSDSPS